MALEKRIENGRTSKHFDMVAVFNQQKQRSSIFYQGAGMTPSRITHSFRDLAFLSVACVAIAASAPAFAKNPLPERETGLWEITLQQGSPMALMMQGMQEAFKQMPEAQRKQMEQMMASSGANLSQMNTLRECVTPEIAKGEFQPAIDDPDMKCSKVDWGKQGKETTYSMTCTSPDGNWTVQGRIWDATSKSYKSDMTMTGTVQGQPVNLEIAHDARWIGPDCQGVKPR